MNRTVILFLLGFFLCIPLQVYAKTDVSAVYRKVGAKRVDINITVAGTAPKAIIVKQKIPKGNTLEEANPKSKGKDKRGTATWIFKHAENGKIVINMTFAQMVNPFDLDGEIRFKQKGSNSMIIKKIK